MFVQRDAHGGFGGFGGCHHLTSREMSEHTSSFTHVCVVYLTNMMREGWQTHHWHQTHHVPLRSFHAGGVA